MNPEFIAVRWFSGRYTVGFVLIKDKYAGFKCYTGPWPKQMTNQSDPDYYRAENLGTEADAIDLIRRTGAKVPFKVALAVFEDEPEFVTGEPIKYDGIDTGVI